MSSILLRPGSCRNDKVYITLEQSAGIAVHVEIQRNRLPVIRVAAWEYERKYYFQWQLRREGDDLKLTPRPPVMPLEDEIRRACKQLIACDDEVEVRAIAERLRFFLYEWLQETRSQIRVLPLLDEAPRRKNAA